MAHDQAMYLRQVQYLWSYALYLCLRILTRYLQKARLGIVDWLTIPALVGLPHFYLFFAPQSVILIILCE